MERTNLESRRISSYKFSDLVSILKDHKRGHLQAPTHVPIRLK